MQISEILLHTNSRKPMEEFVADMEKSTYGLVQTGFIIY
jgi:hypothetical protein